jgi:putative nucleotidyltransferase with HDIG domain
MMKSSPGFKAEAAKELFNQIGRHLLLDDRPSKYLNDICGRPGFEQYPFTMLSALRSTEQSPVHHPEGNAWNHTMLVVDEAASRRSDSRDARVLMWAALLHDIGKPSTTKIRKGRITAYDHDVVGAELSRDFLSELTVERGFIEQVASLIQFHMQILYVVKNLPFADIRGMKQHTYIHEVALLGLCDRLGRTNAQRQFEEEQIRMFLERCSDEHSGNANN